MNDQLQKILDRRDISIEEADGLFAIWRDGRLLSKKHTTFTEALSATLILILLEMEEEREVMRCFITG